MPVFELSHGENVAVATDMRVATFEQVEQIYEFVYRNVTHVSALHPNLASHEDWFALDKEARDRIKRTGKYITSGVMSGPNRALEHVAYIVVLCLDFDEGNLTAEEIEIKCGRWKGIAYETANSCASARRWRVFLPLASRCEVNVFSQLVDAFANKHSLKIDSCSKRPAQPMLLPLMFDDYYPSVFELSGENLLELHTYSNNLATLPDRRALPDFANYRPPLRDLTDDVLWATLNAVDPDGRETWLNVGFALHHQFQAEEAGLQAWIRWSQGSPKYKVGECEKLWRNMHLTPNRSPLTFKWVMVEAKKAKAVTQIANREAWVDKITRCSDEIELRQDIPAKIRNDKHLDQFDRQSLGRVLSRRITDVTGHRMTAAQGNRLLAGTLNEKGEKAIVRNATGSNPEWINGWLYVQESDSFYNMDDRRTCSGQGFNAEYDRMMLDQAGNRIMQATRFALEVAQIPVVQGLMYRPQCDELFEWGGRRYVNRWNPKSVPTPCPSFLWTPEDEFAVETFTDHLNLLFGDEAEGVLNWLAWVVQNEGDHANYSLLIQGPHGVGKSMLGEAMMNIMGLANVRSISPESIVSAWTDWSKDSQLNIVEEIKIAGHNKWEAVNKIKQYITNDVIPIRTRYLGDSTVINTTSYIFFTNYIDSIPIEDGERRYHVLFTKQRTLRDVLAITENDPDYFVRLISAIRTRYDSLRGFLLEYRIPPTFDAKGRAPFSTAQAIMQKEGISEDEYVISETLSDCDGWPGYAPNAGLLCTRHLSDRILDEYRMRVSPHKLAKVLKVLGWDHWPMSSGRIRVNGRQERVWINPNVAQKMTSPEASAKLEATFGREFRVGLA